MYLQGGRLSLVSQCEDTRGQAWQREGEAAGRMASAVRKQEAKKKAAAQFTSFVLCVQPSTPVHGMVIPTFRVGHFSSLRPIWKLPHKYTQSFLSQLSLHPPKFIV